jgi:hypothetical protein
MPIPMISSPKGTARQGTVFDHLSFSAISLFQSCPVRFFFLCGGAHKKYYVTAPVMWLWQTDLRISPS